MNKLCLECTASLACLTGVAHLWKDFDPRSRYSIVSSFRHRDYSKLTTRDERLKDIILVEFHGKEVPLCPLVKTHLDVAKKWVKLVSTDGGEL